MANRFLETNYYKSPFVRGLKGSLKGLYSFIICDCTGSGIWALDLEAASLYIGFQVTMDEFDTCFVKKGKAIDLGNGKYFFPDFIEHQYPKGLQDSNTAHKNVILELKKLNLIDEQNCVFIKKNKRGLEGALTGLDSSIGYGNGYGNGIGYGKDMGLQENFLCPKMLKIMKKHIPSYVEDSNRDFAPLYSIGQFLFNLNGFTGSVVDNTDKICSEWDIICLWLKDDNFYSQKSLKTISTHIQEIINKSKNPKKDGKNLSDYEKQLQSDREKAKNKKYD